jgi:hypothetical protein
MSTPLGALPIEITGRRVILSPFQFFVTGEEAFRVEVLNSASGVTITLDMRFVDQIGSIRTFQRVITPTADRTTNVFVFSLGRGFVQNILVRISTGTSVVGQTFVLLGLQRGLEASAVPNAIILQGYVASSVSLGWPGSPIRPSTEGPGNIRRIAGTAPALGQQITETVPTGSRWRVISFFSRLNTGPVVTNRLPILLVGGGNEIITYAPNTQPANTLFDWHFGSGSVQSFHNGTTNTTRGVAPDWSGQVLKAGNQINTAVVNMQAADFWEQPSIVIEEWIEG